MIAPTVGRVVWYTPSLNDPGGIVPGGPLAAIVAHVWSDTCVNLLVIDSEGGTFSRTSVLLVQPQAEKPVAGPYCEWMPYQISQALKQEAEKQKPMPF